MPQRKVVDWIRELYFWIFSLLGLTTLARFVLDQFLIAFAINSFQIIAYFLFAFLFIIIFVSLIVNRRLYLTTKNLEMIGAIADLVKSKDQLMDINMAQMRGIVEAIVGTYAEEWKGPLGPVAWTTKWNLDLRSASSKPTIRVALSLALARMILEYCKEKEIDISKVKIASNREGDVVLGTCISQILQIPQVIIHPSRCAAKGAGDLDGVIEKKDVLLFVHDVPWGIETTGSCLKIIKNQFKAKVKAFFVVVDRRKRTREKIKEIFPDIDYVPLLELEDEEIKILHEKEHPIASLSPEL